ncbi:hypothetical protein [Adhaeretor mobilis]|uniref:Uncharacterized protein n=1 Tax=Adhaeretor mobilis TaxID=1930276 RepID=A0A517N1U5_9BACT|nr:hypothetical protein [Adhaeretor mobilis]QDT01107.1 hypothetical protein HG15A2_44490 [Adhaeretor mobilis]
MPANTEPFTNVDRSETFDPGEGEYISHDPAQRAQQYLQRGVSQVREMAKDNLGKTIFTALGAGFALGFILTQSSRRSSSSSWTDRIAAEGLGRKILGQLDGVLPDAVSNRLRK